MKIAYLCGSGGTVRFDIFSGEVLDTYNQPAPPVKIDLYEYINHYNKGLEEGMYYDILDFGFWDTEGDYELPDLEWRFYRKISEFFDDPYDPNIPIERFHFLRN